MKPTEIEKGLVEIPIKLREIEQTLVKKNLEKRALEADIAKKEAWMRYEISNETEVVDGKTKKKYSNAEQREYAFIERIKMNTAYINTKMRLQEKDMDIENLKIECNYSKNMHRSMLAIARLTAGDD